LYVISFFEGRKLPAIEFHIACVLVQVVIYWKFLTLLNIPLYGYIWQICLSRHILMDIPIEHFPFLAVLNKAAVNIHVKIFIYTMLFISLGQNCSHRVGTCLTYLKKKNKNCHTCPKKFYHTVILRCHLCLKGTKATMRSSRF
jgi:hypothetical protein